METFCIIATERTGTNHFCRILSNLKSARVYEELFNADGVFTLTTEEVAMVSAAAGTTFTDHRDPRLIEFFHHNPERALALLQASAISRRKSAFLFKAFSGQLSIESLSPVIDTSGSHIILIMRRLIDCYVSFRKAKALQLWQKVDTTGLRIRIDPDHFARWLRRQKHWYAYWHRYAIEHGKGPIVLTYEADIDGRSAAEVLSNFILIAESRGLKLGMPRRIRHLGLPKQDLSASIEDKVDNWHEVAAEIRTRGISELAFGYPIQISA